MCDPRAHSGTRGLHAREDDPMVNKGSEGKADGSNKVITMEGKTNCPATGRRDIPMKTVLRIVSHDQHVFEMYDRSKGNAKTMEISYTRQ